MAVTERNGETLYGKAVPMDLYPAALTGESEPIHLARVGLEATARTVGHVAEFEEKMDLRRNIHLAADVFKAAVPTLEKTGGDVFRVLDSLNTMRNTQLAALDSALREKQQHLGGEIRSIIRTAKNPFAEAGAAIRDGDLEVAAAVLAASPRVSGLTAEQHAQLRLQAQIQFAPDTRKLLDDTERAIMRVERARDFLTDYTRKKKIEWQPSSAAVAKLADLMAKDKEKAQ